MRFLRTAAVLSILAIHGCRIGKAGKDLAVSTGPGGATVRVAAQGRTDAGELIEVREDGIVVVSQKQLSFFAFAALGGLTVDGLPRDYHLSAGERPTREKLARLRLVSHFPQGLTPEIERLLLMQLGQGAMLKVQ